jgi:hypothetical protein
MSSLRNFHFARHLSNFQTQAISCLGLSSLNGRLLRGEQGAGKEQGQAETPGPFLFAQCFFRHAMIYDCPARVKFDQRLYTAIHP